MTDSVEAMVRHHTRMVDSNERIYLATVRYRCRGHGDGGSSETLAFLVNLDMQNVEVRFGRDPMRRVRWLLMSELEPDAFRSMIQDMLTHPSFILRDEGASQVFTVPLVEAELPPWMAFNFRVNSESGFARQYERARQACGFRDGP